MIFFFVHLDFGYLKCTEVAMPPPKRRKIAPAVVYTFDDVRARFVELKQHVKDEKLVLLLEVWLTKLSSFKGDISLRAYQHSVRYRCVGFDFTAVSEDEEKSHQISLKGFPVWEELALVHPSWTERLLAAQAEAPGTSYPGDMCILHMSMEGPSLTSGIFLTSSKKWSVVAACHLFLSTRRQLNDGFTAGSPSMGRSSLKLYFASAPGDDADAVGDAEPAMMGDSEAVIGEQCGDENSAKMSANPILTSQSGYVINVSCKHLHRRPPRTTGVCPSCRFVTEVCLSCGAPCVGCSVVSHAGVEHHSWQNDPPPPVMPVSEQPCPPDTSAELQPFSERVIPPPDAVAGSDIGRKISPVSDKPHIVEVPTVDNSFILCGKLLCNVTGPQPDISSDDDAGEADDGAVLLIRAGVVAVGDESHPRVRTNDI